MQSNYGNRLTASVLSPAIQNKRSYTGHSERSEESQKTRASSPVPLSQNDNAGQSYFLQTISHTPLTISRKCSCGGSCARCKGEEEAERISMSIMKMESPALSHQPSAISYKPSANSSEQNVISEIMSNKGSGQNLDNNTSSFMEQKFGYDFSHVRLHTDSYAARKSNELNAEAFTIGRDVFFNAGRYNPSATEGKKLLAHELTHVVQQRHTSSRVFYSMRIQRRVEAGRVSCERFPRTYPIFTAIGTDDPVGVLEEADARAIEMLNHVIDELTHIRGRVQAGEPPLIADVVALALRNRWHLDPDNQNIWTRTGPRTVEIIIRWYTNIRNTLDSGRLRYVCLGPTCTAGDWARTIPGIQRIRLCRLFWGASIDNRALTLIHEVGHVYYGLRHAEGPIAHCLEQFVADLNGVAILPEFVGVCPL
ncbi:MAG: DUF4157 domain-containing protein [Candidatus Brocadia sp.]|nr:DUF4157 domain-containing protein [Candidatus Brocadia sp.]